MVFLVIRFQRNTCVLCILCLVDVFLFSRCAYFQHIFSGRCSIWTQQFLGIIQVNSSWLTTPFFVHVQLVNILHFVFFKLQWQHLLRICLSMIFSFRLSFAFFMSSSKLYVESLSFTLHELELSCPNLYHDEPNIGFLWCHLLLSRLYVQIVFDLKLFERKPVMSGIVEALKALYIELWHNSTETCCFY